MDILKAVKSNIAQIIVGNDAAIELVMIALVANGHILLEDVPGTGKTSLAKSLARSIDGKFNVYNSHLIHYQVMSLVSNTLI